MQGIKSITQILEPLGMIPLSAIIQPNRQECQQRKALLCHRNGEAAQRHRIKITRKDMEIQKSQAQQLSQKAPPLFPTKKIKHQNHQHTGSKIIDHRYGAEQIACHAHQGNTYPIQPFCFRPSCLFAKANQTECQKEGPKYILMEGIEPSASINQIKGNFRKQCKQKHPFHIFSEIRRMKISFYNHKRKNRECHPADAGHPFLSREQRCPKMVAEHQHHCEGMQKKGAAPPNPFLFQIKFPFHRILCR